MKIIAFEVEDWEAEAFKQLANNHEIETSSQPLRVNNAAQYSDAQAISTFINSQLPANVLEQLDNLRLIATRSTGYDHIDMDFCNDNDITVCNVPTYGSNTVAEHVFGLLLTISHKLDQAIDRTRKGDFSPRGLQGFDLNGRTLGVIGTGDIGRQTITIASGFGMKVLAYDMAEDEEAAEQLGFEYVTLEQLLQESDIVTLHVPSNDKTRHMIGNEQFDLMKDNSVLINTARGDIVDIRALSRALAEEKIAAAGLDVLPEEPVVREEAELLRSVYEREHNLETLLANHILAHMRNVVVTPHSAFNTREAVQRIIDTTIENIEAFNRSETINSVN